MNARALAIALFLVAATATAQTPAPAPAGDAVARPVSTAPAPRSADDRPSSSDPRVCLEFATREEVIACAERFRPRRGAAKT